MIFYWTILFFILAISVIFCIYFFLEHNKAKKENKLILSELISEKKKPLIIWKINKYKKEELSLLLSNPEVLELLMSITEYNIAKKTDTLRFLNNWQTTEYKVWYIDCLHESHLFFYKLREKIKDKEDKIPKNLV